MQKKGHELVYHNGIYTLYIDGEFIIESNNLDEVLEKFKKENTNIATVETI